MLDKYDISLINNILFLSGSGLDAESGIQTFRAADGLWAGHDVYSVCSATAFKNDPDTVYSFYNKRRRELKSVKPNQAHYSLVDLEKDFEVNIVTQNISGLHKEAGSTKVIELHGSLKKSFCLDNNHTFDWENDLNASDLCPICQSQMRLGIVMFEENVYHLDEVQNLANNADLFVYVTEFDIENDMSDPTDFVNGDYKRMLKLHFSMVNKNGKVEDTFVSFTKPMSKKITNKIEEIL